MKSWIKKLLCAALCLVLTLSLLPLSTRAEDASWIAAASSADGRQSVTVIDPYYQKNYPELYERVKKGLEPDAVKLRKASVDQPADPNATATTVPAAGLELLPSLKAHKASATIMVKMPADTADTYEKQVDLCLAIWDAALRMSTDPMEGDYVRRATPGFNADWDDEPYVSNGYAYLEYKYEPYYWGGLTEANEKEMAAAADAVLAGLGFSAGTSNYDKIHMIYRWIVENIEYDYDALEDTKEAEALLEFDQTAYSAIITRKTVCAGFSHLLYYMLWKSQVPARYIAGLGGTGDDMGGHAWNMVWFRGAWYSLDVTWDENIGAGYGAERFFLRGRDTDFYKPGKLGTSYYHVPDGPDNDLGFDDAALVEDSSPTDYGVRADADKKACTAHTQADTTYVTDSGESVYWCSVCGHTQYSPYPRLEAPKLVSVTELSGGVEFKWKASDGAVKYRVYRKVGSGSWKKLADTAETSYIDKDVTVGKTYSYTVRGVSSAGKLSPYDKTGLKLKYTGKVLAVPELGSVTMKKASVQFKWKATDGAVKYRVLRKTGSGSWKKIAEVTGTSYTDKKVSAGTTYSYSVRAVDADGNLSAYDKTGLKLTFITAPELVSVKKVSSGVKFTWKSAAGAEKYRVYRKTGSGSWKYLAQTSRTYYVDRKAVSGKTYTYTVRGRDAYGHLSRYDTIGLSIKVK